MNLNTISLPWWARPTNLAIHPKIAIRYVIGNLGDLYLFWEHGNYCT
jgi:hypothetical protein